MARQRLGVLVLLLVGCPSTEKADPPVSGDADTDADSDADTDTDTDTDEDTDTDVPPCDTSDSALGTVAYFGDGVFNNGTFTGTTYVRFETLGLGKNPSVVFCEWTWTTTGVDTTVATPCEDAGGKPCPFALDLNNTGGQVTGGNACHLLFPTQQQTFDETLGHMPNYNNTGYDILMSYRPTGGYWMEEDYSSSTSNPSTGEWSYEWLLGTFYFPDCRP